MLNREWGDGGIQGLDDLILIAIWISGTVLILCVGALAIGALMWAAGKIDAQSAAARSGMKIMTMACAGALLLGSFSGGMKWATTPERTEKLMPEAAGQRTLSIDRPAPSTHCMNRVAIQAENHRAAEKNNPDALEKTKPSDEAHNELHKLLSDMGGLEMDAEESYSRSVIWGRNGKRVKNKQWKDDFANNFMSGTEDRRLSSVRWLPNGDGSDCSIENKKPASGLPIQVVIWEKETKGSGQSARHEPVYYIFELTVTD